MSEAPSLMLFSSRSGESPRVIREGQRVPFVYRMFWMEYDRLDISGLDNDAVQVLFDAAEASSNFGLPRIHCIFLADTLVRRGVGIIGQKPMDEARGSWAEHRKSVWHQSKGVQYAQFMDVLKFARDAAAVEGRDLVSPQDLWMGLMMGNNSFRMWLCSEALWNIAPDPVTAMPRYWQMLTMRQLSWWPRMLHDAQEWKLPVTWPESTLDHHLLLQNTRTLGEKAPSDDDGLKALADDDGFRVKRTTKPQTKPQSSGSGTSTSAPSPHKPAQVTAPSDDETDASAATASVAEKRPPSGKQSRKAMLRGELKPMGAWNPDTVWSVLQAEFPWMEEANELAASSAAAIAEQVLARFPPMLIVGAPGLGKTRWARRLAEIGAVYKVVANAGGSASGAVINGFERAWNNSNPSIISRAMTECGASNPFIVIDEVDKATSNPESGGSIHDALLPLLEDESAVSYRDIWHDAAIDASRVNWVLTANSVDSLPRPLLDRLEIIRVRRPTEAELRAVLAVHCGEHEHASTDLDRMVGAWHEGGMRGALRMLARLKRSRLWKPPCIVVGLPPQSATGMFVAEARTNMPVASSIPVTPVTLSLVQRVGPPTKA